MAATISLSDRLAEVALCRTLDINRAKQSAGEFSPEKRLAATAKCVAVVQNYGGCWNWDSYDVGR